MNWILRPALFLLLSLTVSEAAITARYPADGTKGIPLEGEALKWDRLNSALSYNVFMAGEKTKVESATESDKDVWQGNTTDTSFEPGKLEAGKTYYWRVDGIAGAPADNVKGQTWSFTATKSAILTRLNGGRPIIDSTLPGTEEPSKGYLSINGPSLIRVPDWIPPEKRADPSAVYYLYFGHHSGQHIRMAWAKNIAGPYTVYNPGKGVVLREEIDALTFGHISSPDVHVDDAHHRIYMYVGALCGSAYKYGGGSLALVSQYGLDFMLPVHAYQQGTFASASGAKPMDALLTDFYPKEFGYQGDLFAITNFGYPYKARNPKDPWNADANGDGNSDIDLSGSTRDYLWTEGKTLVEKNAPEKTWRHNAVQVRGDTLDVWFTTRAEMPERIRYTTINLAVTGGMDKWEFTPPVDVLEPEMTWEGGDLPLTKSKNAQENHVRELRDPAFFKDVDGKEYMLYAGSGEEGIGIAQFNSTLEIPVAARWRNAYSDETELHYRSGVWEVEPHLGKSFTVRLFDLAGKLLQSRDRKGGGILTLSTKGLRPGIYLISLQSQGENPKVFRLSLP